MRELGLLLLLATVTLGASKAEQKAKAKIDATNDLWKVFVLERDKLSNDDLKGMLDNYDTAIEILHAISEKGENAAADSTILLLARRTAKIRYTLWQREMRKRAEAAAKEKADTKLPAPPKKRPSPKEKEKPGTGTQETMPATIDVTVFETKSERTHSINLARRCVFDYFRAMKFGAIVGRCGVCNGDGKIRYPVRQGREVIYRTKPCQSCRLTGAAFRGKHERHAYKALLRLRTPLARRDTAFRAKFRAQVEAWKARPEDIEWISRLSIKKVEYRGLTATVRWVETIGREKRENSANLLRIGRTWYFYTPETDAELLRVPE